MPLCICIIIKKKVTTPALFRSTVGEGVAGPLGRKDASHAPLFFFLLCSAKRDEATQQEAVSGPAGGASHYHPGEQEWVAPRESQQIDSLPADGDSHSARESGRSCCQQKSAGKFLCACARRKPRFLVFPFVPRPVGSSCWWYTCMFTSVLLLKKSLYLLRAELLNESLTRELCSVPPDVVDVCCVVVS